LLDKLKTYALVVRKYNLGDRNYFFSKFPAIKPSHLETAWAFGLKEIQNKEIIKNVGELHSSDLKIVESRVNKLESNPAKLFHYLDSEFDVKKLKLTEENIERRVRHLAAVRYLEIASIDILANNKGNHFSFKNTISGFLRICKYAFVITLIVGLFFIPRIKDGFTSVDVLTERIHEKSKYKYRVGATCKDGWHSNSTGQGTCSHHGGVKEWLYETEYRKSIEECREEAKKLSWRD